MTRKDLRRLVKSALRQAHRDIERKTGLMFGRLNATGSYTSSGYPLDKAWLVICPRRDGFAFSLSIKRLGVYVDYVPKHVEVSA